MIATTASGAPGFLPQSSAGRSGFAAAIVISIVAHAIAIGLGVVRLEFARAPEAAQPIPVELVPEPARPKPTPPAPAPPKPDESQAIQKPREPSVSVTTLPPPAKGDGAGKSDSIRADLDALRVDVEKCWKVPSGWTDPRQVTVVVDFTLTEAGDVPARPTVIEFSANQYGAAAAKNAIDAVLKCGPYKLPPETYKDWQHVQIRLAPPG